MKIFLIFVLSIMITSTSFYDEQLGYDRVAQAYDSKWSELQKAIISHLGTDEFHVFIRAFKQEQELEIWLRPTRQSDAAENEWKLFRTYSVCAASGQLGPKRQQGDFQVPEGFYQIDRWNPWSNYHLSLGINYPNAADRILGKAPLGGDIFIHGDCVTIGCLPMTNEIIKEIYVLTIIARKHEQASIQVHIFPFRFADTKLGLLANDPVHQEFWRSLQKGYEYFENCKKIPRISVNNSGQYELRP